MCIDNIYGNHYITPSGEVITGNDIYIFLRIRHDILQKVKRTPQYTEEIISGDMDKYQNVVEKLTLRTLDGERIPDESLNKMFYTLKKVFKEKGSIDNFKK